MKRNICLITTYLGTTLFSLAQYLGTGQTEIPDSPDKATVEINRIESLPVPKTQFEVEQEFTDAKRAMQDCDYVIKYNNGTLPKLQEARQILGDLTALNAAVLVFSNDLETVLATSYSNAPEMMSDSTNKPTTATNPAAAPSTNGTAASILATNAAMTGSRNPVATPSFSQDVTRLIADFSRITDQIPENQLSLIRFDGTGNNNDVNVFLLALENIRSQVMAGQIYDYVENTFYQTFPRTNAVMNVAKISNSVAISIQKMETHNKIAADIKQAWSKRDESLSTALLKFQNGTAKQVATNLPWMIGCLAAFGIAVIWIVMKFNHEVQMEWVASGQVIQLLTVVSLLLIILCLALSNIITENTVGTLLGGIGGYVLSQGIGRAAGRAAARNISKSVDKEDKPDSLK